MCYDGGAPGHADAVNHPPRKTGPRQPSSPQIKRLQDALLSAHASESTLRQMVRVHLDASLDAVVPLHRQNQSDIVFDLIERYAATRGGLHALIKAAVAGNPGNQLLAIVADELLAIAFDPLPVPPDRRRILWVNVPPKPAAPLLGRDDLLADLLARLSAGHNPALSTDGLPGVGKTALAHDARVRQLLPAGARPVGFFSARLFSFLLSAHPPLSLRQSLLRDRRIDHD